MITKEEAKALIESFFNGAGPFSEARELRGHAASGRPDAFSKWFSAQKTEDQRTVASILVDAALFKEERSEKILPTAFLLADIARKFPLGLMPKDIRTLEQFILRGDKVSVWLNDEDTEHDEMKDQRTRWRFALMLWNVLMAVGSPIAAKAFERFSEHARDPEFVRGLTLAKQVHKRSPFEF